MSDLATMPATVPAFDYDVIELADRSALRIAADRIRDRMGSIKRDFIAIGRELIGVKGRLNHGAFETWIVAELDITPRAARNYMGAARMLNDVPEAIRETVSELPPVTLYKLAAPSTPKEIVAEIVKAAEAGAMPEPAAIETRIDEATREAREIKKAQKPGRSVDDAKKLIARRRADAARHREQWRIEEDQRRAETEAAKVAMQATVARLVAEHLEIMQEISAALDGPARGYLPTMIRDALRERAVASAEAAAQ